MPYPFHPGLKSFPCRTVIALPLLVGLLFASICARGQTTVPEAVPSKLIRQGRAYVSLTFSLDQRLAENENRLGQEVIDQDLVEYAIRLNSGYALRDNLTLGVGLRYARDREDRTFLEDGQEITTQFVSQAITFGPNMRNFVPLGNGTLQIVVQTDLAVTLEESLERIFSSSDIDKVEGNQFELGLGVRPGAVLFFDRHWAFEVLVGLAGLSTRINTLTRNDDEENRTRVVRNGIDLQINLLALNLGVAYYF